MGFLSSLTGGDVGSNTLKALKTNTGLLNGFDATGNSIIDTGEQKSTDAINAGIAGYQPYADAGTKALGTYTDALGLNGDAGNAAATAAFHTSPGYDFAMDQGTTAALRGASAAGMLNSGNTLTALTKFGQGTADQEYGSWLDRLSSLQGEGLTAAGGQQAGDAQLATTYSNGADNRLNLENTVTQGQIGINTQTAGIQDQQDANKSSFLGKLIGGVGSLALKPATGGLF
ncbi:MULTISPECIES: hypothetical protein [unclassified Rhizobium]|uniref:hypothetical protein n=1 Tax=unclassified Rhizobium TaxID=2613769 RepID=UPI001ADBC4BE|nr:MULTISPECIES: hypothetical protein [unclassified Rhizobium]MBO9100340.1 hypothetical protein [Rhizobium sp. L58/93]MBO9186233.1 hypothetical protein [Rhizobium sp. E27B/91]QXZ83151.1 hypothetical protein J5287_13865 [Rhizobium sp. K1/93]QXZ89337.1 hypothetical protein J5280_14725 [Rhizobium sp. K15/93]QYA01925.1 hypothetical protein J5278_01665 [Rhizobium sp. B21/90]